MKQNPSAGASSPRLAKAYLRPTEHDEQPIADFYLAGEDDVAKIPATMEQAIDDEQMERVGEIAAEDGSDPRIGEILPVSFSRVIRARLGLTFYRAWCTTVFGPTTSSSRHQQSAGNGSWPSRRTTLRMRRRDLRSAERACTTRMSQEPACCAKPGRKWVTRWNLR